MFSIFKKQKQTPPKTKYSRVLNNPDELQISMTDMVLAKGLHINDSDIESKQNYAITIDYEFKNAITDKIKALDDDAIDLLAIMHTLDFYRNNNIESPIKFNPIDWDILIVNKAINFGVIVFPVAGENTVHVKSIMSIQDAMDDFANTTGKVVSYDNGRYSFKVEDDDQDVLYRLSLIKPFPHIVFYDTSPMLKHRNELRITLSGHNIKSYELQNRLKSSFGRVFLNAKMKISNHITFPGTWDTNPIEHAKYINGGQNNES